MKKNPAKSKTRSDPDRDEILPEYDSAKASRNPYADRRRDDTTVVQLDPDVAKYFPDSTAVNEALRALSSIIKHRKKSRRSA